MKLKHRQIGFTLVETIVASTILCGSVLTITAVCSKALTNTRTNRQYETALSLIDRQLNLIDYIGIDEFVELGEFDGEFDGFVPTYYWEAAINYENIDNLYYITITVNWFDHNRPYSISIDTMLDGVSIYAETEESEAI